MFLSYNENFSNCNILWVCFSGKNGREGVCNIIVGTYVIGADRTDIYVHTVAAAQLIVFLFILRNVKDLHTS